MTEPPSRKRRRNRREFLSAAPSPPYNGELLQRSIGTLFMPSVLSLPIRLVLVIGLLALIASLTAPLAQAQLLPGAGGSTEAPAGGLATLIEEARRNGSTVIVVTPGGEDEASTADAANALRTEQFLKARARIREIVLSVPTLVPSVESALRKASPEGGFFWAVRAIGTALIGFLVGWFVITRIQTAGRDYFSYMYDPNPETTADKAKYLLFRVAIALVYAVVVFVMIMAVAIIFDPVLEASRRLIFEFALAYAVYRVMRRGVAWNLFAYDAPSHRLVNLADDEAIRMDRDWGIAVGAVLIFVATARFLHFSGDESLGTSLTAENIRFLQICSAALFILVFALFTLRHNKSLRHAFAPRAPDAPMFRVRTNLARFVPAILLLYAVFAFIAFVFQLALDQPAPALVIVAPFIIIFAAMIAYGLALMLIQWFYKRRIRRLQELAAAERAHIEREAQSTAVAGDGEIAEPTDDAFEHHPVFRSFFESAALAIIAAVALRELGRFWGIDVSGESNLWAAFLNIALAGILCWLGYRALSLFIDHRMELEGGAPEPDAEQELGGEGGGPGASRVATLLPIMRYVMIIVLFSTAVMVILSTLGFDIAPIFAGAGVVGLAVGFGAQTLIRDVFSGAFFLMDDAFRKGEYVEINATRGSVEKISIRSFQLRHHLGALHTIPFGEVNKLTNYSRDWVMTKLPLRVTYDTDVESVRKLIKKLGQKLLEHPVIGHEFMEPLKSQGVYKMEDSAMIIRVKFMTKPGKQFSIRKIVYESIQEIFAKEGIHFAHKEVTVRLADGARVDNLSEQQKLATTSAARSVIDAEEEAASQGGGANDGR
jgi:moderate conductance mechanosensitive channel